MPNVSVILPIYNVEKYLKQCIESLVNQTLSDIEMIFVDDCSTDNSVEIIKSYMQKDKHLIGEWYRNNKEKVETLILTTKQKLCITIIEFMCIYYIINNLMLRIPKFSNNIFYIAVFAITMILFIAKKGYISKFLEKDFWYKFSKYTYSLYMTHVFVLTLFTKLLWVKHPNLIHLHPILNLIILWICILTLGISTYHFVEKPCANYLKKHLQINKER